MMKQINVTDELPLYSYGATIDEVLESIKDLYNSKAFTNVSSVEIGYKRDYGDGIDTVLRVNYKRDETKSEYANRIKIENQNKKYREKLFQDLKKEFGE